MNKAFEEGYFSENFIEFQRGGHNLLTKKSIIYVENDCNQIFGLSITAIKLGCISDWSYYFKNNNKSHSLAKAMVDRPVVH